MKNLFVRQRNDARRREAIDEARAAGRFGATNIPLSLSMDASLSDTFVGRLSGALRIGQQQRTGDPEYAAWLAANTERLSEDVLMAGVEDTGSWLRARYTKETGRTAL